MFKGNLLIFQLKKEIIFLSLKDIFADKATERKILSLIIKCPSDGCEWTGELRYKEVV